MEKNKRIAMTVRIDPEELTRIKKHMLEADPKLKFQDYVMYLIRKDMKKIKKEG